MTHNCYSWEWWEALRQALLQELFMLDLGTKDWAEEHGIPWAYVVRLKARRYKGIPQEEADKIARAFELPMTE